MNLNRLMLGIALLLVGAFASVLSTDYRRHATQETETAERARRDPAVLYGGQTIFTVERRAKEEGTKATVALGLGLLLLTAGAGLAFSGWRARAVPAPT